GAVGQGDLRLDGGVAPGVQYFAPDDLFDFQIIHVHYLLMICPCGAAWAAPCRLVIVYHISTGSTRGSLWACGYALLMTLRLPVALSVSFADSSPTGGAKSTPVGVGQAVVRQTCSPLRLTRRLPGLTVVHLAPPSGELARRPQGGETERGVCPTFPTKSRFIHTQRKKRNARKRGISLFSWVLLGLGARSLLGAGGALFGRGGLGGLGGRGGRGR